MELPIYPQEIKGFKKIEIVERPDEPDQFEMDLRNSKDGTLKDRDNFNRWAMYFEDGVLKICFYPYHIKNH